MPFSKVIHYLRMHCHAGMTGAFYLVTDQGHWGEFLINRGKVVTVRYRALRGIKALQLLRRSATQAKYSFNTDGFKLDDRAKDGEVLPETEKILQFLAKPPEANSGDEGKAGAARSSAPPPKASQADRKPAAAPARKPATDRQAELRSRAGIPSRDERMARQAAEAAKTRDKGGAAAANGYTVLVVEDSIISRKVISNTLSPRGYRIIEAGDGFQALAQLTNEKPDLVLLDLILPGMDGYKVLSHMKKKPEFEGIPVIILTSRDTLFDKLKGKMSGSDEYLTKPFSSVELVDRVSKYLK